MPSIRGRDRERRGRVLEGEAETMSVDTGGLESIVVIIRHFHFTHV